MKINPIDDPSAEPLYVGGRYDTILREWAGPANEYVTWDVGIGQMPPLRRTKNHFVVVGAMGAGKTEVLARTAILSAMRYGRNRSIGVVAPTQKRLQIIWDKILSLLLTEWIDGEPRLSAGEIPLINGCKLQFVSAKIYSQAIGSPIQGYSWVSAVVDEMQDLEDSALADVFLRGRDSKDGSYPVTSSCTIKDTSAWRSRRQRLDRESTTTIYRMEATANPFVPKEYWENLRTVLTEREYKMRVEAIDMRSERAIYPSFDRATHLRPLPMGVRDVTKRVTGASTLIGFDPGTIYDVSIILRCYEIPGVSKPVWYVLDEVTTQQSTTEMHGMRLLQRLREDWGVQFQDVTEPQAIIRADPYGNTSSDARPHVTVYRELEQQGFRIAPAQWNDKSTGPGSIPKEARISTVCRLLKDAGGETRLYFATDENGVPRAKRLVSAIEVSERDEMGKAETERKSTRDVSHWPCALGYGLWPYEKTRRDPSKVMRVS